MGHPCWERGWEGPRAWPMVRHLGCRWGCPMGQRSLWGSDWDYHWDSLMGHQWLDWDWESWRVWQKARHLDYHWDCPMGHQWLDWDWESWR
eukprot:scaffold27025_cov130-Amphora_coffeaeformis.AAC.1